MAYPPHVDAVFFDDSPIHIEAVRELCPNIHPVYVEPVPHGEGVDYLYQSSREGNNYAIMLRTVYESGSQPPHVINDMISPVVGFFTTEFNGLVDWVENREGTGYVLFDWDRTLSRTSGFLPPSSFPDLRRAIERQPNSSQLLRLFDEALSRYSGKDLMEYLLGGSARVEAIRNMFDFLQWRGYQVYIITDNSACYEEFFKEMIRELYPLPTSHILCSMIAENKAHYLLMTDFICGRGDRGEDSGEVDMEDSPPLLPVPAQDDMEDL